jgi:hypothetical protein
MKTYITKIDFEFEKNCGDCPLCDEYDTCILQNNKEFDTFEQQMKKCPLILEGENNA